MQGIDPILSPNHPNLIAMYTMDNISGSTLNDETSNGRNMTIDGATTPAGIIGNAIDTDAVNDKVFGANSDSSAFAVAQGAISILLPTLDATERILFGMMSNTGSSARKYILLTKTTGNKIQLQIIKSGYSKFLASSDLFTGDMSVVIQSTGTNYELYVNGVSETFGITGTDTADDGDWFDEIDDPTADRRTTIGHVQDAGTDFYRRSLADQIRVFDRVLTSDEITTIHNEAFG